MAKKDRDFHLDRLQRRAERLLKFIRINAPDSYIAIECGLIFASGCALNPDAAGGLLAKYMGYQQRAGHHCIECGADTGGGGHVDLCCPLCEAVPDEPQGFGAN